MLPEPSSGTLFDLKTRGKCAVASITFIDIFDSRGRLDRKGFAAVTLLLAAAQTCAYAAMAALQTPLTTPASYVIHSFLLWTAGVAICKRLHDLDFGGRALVIATAVYLLWSAGLTFFIVDVLGEAAFADGGNGTLLVIAASALPLVLALVWLHAAAGDAGCNRFGPPRGRSPSARAHAKRPAANLNPSSISS